MGKVEDAAQEWSDKYSRDGEFEESGQREAFHAGWNKALESISSTDLISEKYRLRESNKLLLRDSSRQAREINFLSHENHKLRSLVLGISQYFNNGHFMGNDWRRDVEKVLGSSK